MRFASYYNFVNWSGLIEMTHSFSVQFKKANSCRREPIVWRKPLHPWDKLNIDEAYKSSSKQVRCGCVLWDNEARPIISYYNYIKADNIMNAELKGLWLGL